MALDFSKFGTPVEQSSALDFAKFGTPVQPPPEKESAFRQVADIPLGIAKGAVQGVRMIADAFGAGTDTSKTIKSAETYLADLMSAQAKNDQQEISRIMKDAEDKGVLDQVKAGIKAFTVAPIDTLSSALGTAAPVIAGALGAQVLGAGALVSTGVSVLTGAGMGAGTIKGSIYEETKSELKKAGALDEEAERRAQLAQQYNGKNLDQILLGTMLGGAAAVGPLEKGGAAFLARKILGKTGAEATETVAEQAAKGALRRRAEAGVLEAIPEAVQAGQEKVAQNIALQREGFEDVPTFRGAVGAATLEALAGAGLGATIGGGKPEVAPAIAPEAPPSIAPATPPVEAPTAEVPPVEAPPSEPPIAPPVETPVAEAPPAEPTATPPVAETPPVETPPVEPAVEPPAAPPVAEAPTEAPKVVTAQMLEDIGVKPTAAIVKRIEGLSIDAPEVASELTRYANRYAAPEVKVQIQSFVQSIATPAAPEVVSAAPEVTPPSVETTTVPEAPSVAEPPKLISVQMLQDIGVMPSAAVVKRIEGLPMDDPKVATELESYANRYATPEVKPQILNFVQTLTATPEVTTPEVAKPETPAAVPPIAVGVAPVAAQPSVAETPTVETPVVQPTTPVAQVPAVETPVTPVAETPSATTVEAPEVPVAPKVTTPEAPTAPKIQLQGRDIPVALSKVDEKSGNVLVSLDTAKADDSWKSGDVNKTLYIGPGGTKNAIKDRYANFGEFAKTAEQIDVPSIVVDENGKVSFEDGRHRFAYMRDQGLENIPVAMSPESRANAIKSGLIAPEVLPEISPAAEPVTQPKTLEEFRERMPVKFYRPEIEAANNEGNFVKLTKALQQSSNPAIRRIGQLGGGIASQITLKKPRNLGGNTAGVFDPNDDSIQMIPSYAGDEHTNAHETLHALISKAQQRPTDKQKPVVEKIEKLYQHVRKELRKQGISYKGKERAYGLKNAREFAAEAMTDPDFQFLLMKIPYQGNKTAWTQFVK